MKKFIKSLKNIIKNKKEKCVDSSIASTKPQLPVHKKLDKQLLQSEINLLAIEKIEKEKKIFNIGMPKTGTTSMETLWEKLGYRVCRGYWDNKDSNFLQSCYAFGQIDEILNVTHYYDAFADAPWGGTELYRKLAKMYPDAYFIHTVREPEKWYKSFLNMYLMFDENIATTLETMRSFGSYGNYLFMKKVFGIETMENSEKPLISRFNEYNKDVENFFKDSKYNYLKLDITSDEVALKKISEFLQNDKVIEVGLPHSNKGSYSS